MKSLREYLESHPFFAGLDAAQLDRIAGLTSEVSFDADRFLFKEGGEADRMFILREGRVRLELYDARKGPVAVQTLDADEVVGWSWIVAPYRWHFDGRALVATRALALQAAGLRAACDSDRTLGYVIMKSVAQVMSLRLQATRLQIMDLYRDDG